MLFRSVTTDESMKLTISCKKNVFDIEHLEFQYLENVPVLQDINLTIDHRPTAIIGQNGAGKTTLVKLLKGLLKPVGGSIYYGGSDMAEIRFFQQQEDGRGGLLFPQPAVLIGIVRAVGTEDGKVVDRKSVV